jgi:hypothetical protein
MGLIGDQATRSGRQIERDLSAAGIVDSSSEGSMLNRPVVLIEGGVRTDCALSTRNYEPLGSALRTDKQRGRSLDGLRVSGERPRKPRARYESIGIDEVCLLGLVISSRLGRQPDVIV